MNENPETRVAEMESNAILDWLREVQSSAAEIEEAKDFVESYAARKRSLQISLGMLIVASLLEISSVKFSRFHRDDLHFVILWIILPLVQYTNYREFKKKKKTYDALLKLARRNDPSAQAAPPPSQ
jgi:hypothetical protein